MLYVKFDGEIPVAVSSDPPKDKQMSYTQGGINHHYTVVDHDVWQNRNDWKSYERVQRIARLLEATTSKKFLATDAGPHVSPRYDIIEPPKVGDKVSYGFNGDYYPDGEIVKITKTYQITTSTGNKYLRRRNTGTWLRTGGTWALVPGHINERNPSF